MLPEQTVRHLREAPAAHDAQTPDTDATPAIPGWRLIVSDTGRYWAIRNRAFPRVALRAGVEPAVDADTFEEVREAVAEQEEKARDAVAKEVTA
ncbi:hypothetical protein [Streptosporangium saharense]|uniref:hypothetical protein n=1 Tax=Streptosporangium saharense TaxID=1706840 RepID=UPI00332D381C